MSKRKKSAALIDSDSDDSDSGSDLDEVRINFTCKMDSNNRLTENLL